VGYLLGGLILVPSFPVYGFVFGFVDQLLLKFLSGFDCRWAATYVPSLRTYPRTPWLRVLLPVPGPILEEWVPPPRRAKASWKVSVIKNSAKIPLRIILVIFLTLSFSPSNWSTVRSQSATAMPAWNIRNLVIFDGRFTCQKTLSVDKIAMPQRRPVQIWC